MKKNKDQKEPSDFLLGVLAFIAIPAAIFLLLGIIKIADSDTIWSIVLGILSIFVIVGLLTRNS